MLHIPQGLNLGPGIKLIKINRNLSFVSNSKNLDINEYAKNK